MSRPPGTMHSCLELLEPRRLLSSAIIYVDLNAPGPAHDRSSWQQAHVDLQDALAAARAGDQIRVADGTYSPGTNFGDRFQLKDGTATRGGYAGYGAANPDARDVNAFRTILTSNNYGNDIGVVSADGTGRGTILDGFTIKTVGWIQVGITNVGGAPTISNCTFTGGAGIDNRDGASPLISNCVFIDGLGEIAGAIGLYESKAQISNCTFTRYHSVFGGAISSLNSSSVVRNCTFAENQAAHEGQAVWLYSSTATFIDCDFTRNGQFSEGGGAIYTTGPEPLTLTRCTFTENTAGGAYGGAIAAGDAQLNITGCRFTRNKGGTWGGAIIGSGPMTITNSIFEANTAYYNGAIDGSIGGLLLVNCLFSGNAATGSNGRGGALSGGGTIINCTFSGNTSNGVGGAIAGGATLRNSILWGNCAAVAADEIYPSDPSYFILDHSIVRGAGPFSHRFVRDPDPGADATWGTADDDYGDLRPTIDSDAIDAGSNKLVPRRIRTDLAGDRRLVGIPDRGAPGRGVDIGAYELQRTRRASADKLVIRAPRPAPAIDFHGAVDATNLRLAELFE